MSEPLFLASAEETIAAGHDLALKSPPGTIIALVGDLGAGKTHFSKGFATGLGIDPESVSSPTFTLLNEYRAEKCDLYHFDFYRLKDISELDGLGWDDILDQNGIVLAEWANMFPEVFPEGTIWIELHHSEGGREMSVR